MTRRKLDTSKRPGITVHGAKLPTYQKSDESFLEAARRRGMTRSSRAGTDRHPKGGQP
ncbi:hypothetical protein OG320_14360 [Microbispora sp. NBC_01189]|uniref:hypothetical protein n=1 Tax=Microbispora sp. NBC_01189 TaxID=2903583 RepID=UPI002E10C2F3|nr:hypothetical protein OG320_14360 [Microbispora sp. NBC_01189]